MSQSTKKKILFIITQSEMGGAQKFLHTLINHEKIERFDILLATGQQGNENKENISSLNRSLIKTFFIKHLIREISPFDDFLALLEIFNLIRKERPNILFLCSTKAGALGAIAGKLFMPPNSRPRVIYRIGGWAFNEKISALKKKIYFWIEKDTAYFKDKIIVNSNHDRQQALDLKICPPEKIITVYNGIDQAISIFLDKKSARKIIDKKLNINCHSEFISESEFNQCNYFGDNNTEKSILIGTVANFYKNKGLDYLIEAVNILQISNFKFIIFGDGRERENLEQLIKKYGLQKKVILPGTEPNASQLLKAFDIFVLPSIKEGMPWSILEAMLAGLPIIATKVGGVPEMIINKESGLLIDPANPKQLASAIKELIENKELREKLGANAKKRVTEKFSLEKMIEKTLNIIEER